MVFLMPFEFPHGAPPEGDTAIDSIPLDYSIKPDRIEIRRKGADRWAAYRIDRRETYDGKVVYFCDPRGQRLDRTHPLYEGCLRAILAELTWDLSNPLADPLCHALTGLYGRVERQPGLTEQIAACESGLLVCPGGTFTADGECPLWLCPDPDSLAESAPPDSGGQTVYAVRYGLLTNLHFYRYRAMHSDMIHDLATLMLGYRYGACLVTVTSRD